MNDVAKSGWLSVATFLFTLFRDEGHLFAEGDDGLTIGDALKANETSPASAAVELQEGLALIHDPSLSDDYLGEVMPCWLEGTREVSIPINTASSSRIVSVFITYQQLETDERERWFRDPEEEQTYREQTPHTVEWDTEIRVVEGTPGSGQAPDPPSDGGPWLRICDIDRPVAQTQVKDNDITDQRNRDVAHLSEIISSAGVRLIRGTGLSFEESSYFATLFPNETEGQLEFYDDTGSGLSFGHLWLGTLEAIERLETPVLRALGGNNADLLDLQDSGGNEGEGKLRLSELWAQAGQILLRNQDDSGWGDLKAGVFEATGYFEGLLFYANGGANSDTVEVRDESGGGWGIVKAGVHHAVNALKSGALRGTSGSGSDEVHVRDEDGSTWGVMHARNTAVAHGRIKYDGSEWVIEENLNFVGKLNDVGSSVDIELESSTIQDNGKVHPAISQMNQTDSGNDNYWHAAVTVSDQSGGAAISLTMVKVDLSAGTVSRAETPPSGTQVYLVAFHDRA
jgi:hypothetical protein